MCFSVRIDTDLPSDASLCLILQDHLTVGRQAPPPDASQDWTLTYSSEYNGVTTLRFYRKLNTADEQGDVVIQVPNNTQEKHIHMLCVPLQKDKFVTFQVKCRGLIYQKIINGMIWIEVTCRLLCQFIVLFFPSCRLTFPLLTSDTLGLASTFRTLKLFRDSEMQTTEKSRAYVFFVLNLT